MKIKVAYYCGRRNIPDGNCSYVCGEPRPNVDEPPLQCTDCCITGLKVENKQLLEENAEMKAYIRLYTNLDWDLLHKESSDDKI
jgi:hypothetical protein